MRSWDFDLSKRCEHVRPTQCMQLLGFSCGNEDIDTFFHLEVSDYETELMAKTYAFTDPERGNMVVSVFSLSNDSIKTDTLTNQVRNRLQRCIPNAKRKHSYPSEDCERDARRIQESRLRTRTMYCDLRLWLLRQTAGLSGTKYDRVKKQIIQ